MLAYKKKILGSKKIFKGSLNELISNYKAEIAWIFNSKMKLLENTTYNKMQHALLIYRFRLSQIISEILNLFKPACIRSFLKQNLMRINIRYI